MASSLGSSRGVPRPSFKRFSLLAAVLLAVCATDCARAQHPAYARTALEGFNTGMPAGWAYTLATTRNGHTITERFDPTRPSGAQWTLLETEGRTPTATEIEKYTRARGAAPGGMQANFERADIEPGSLILVQEDAEHAEFTAAFRETSTGPDKMLGHLSLRLRVAKRVPHVAGYTLELKEPYSPVLGVKMNALRVEARFSPPTDNRPSLPVEMTSRFTGRIFFISTGEDLHLSYRDVTPPPTELSR
jgi:hypothetical protein